MLHDHRNVDDLIEEESQESDLVSDGQLEEIREGHGIIGVPETLVNGHPCPYHFLCWYVKLVIQEAVGIHEDALLAKPNVDIVDGKRRPRDHVKKPPVQISSIDLRRFPHLLHSPAEDFQHA
eukprot:7667202-Prorocentrum_lima.AAC.1